MKDKSSGEYLAVMANTVARARHSLTVPEQRLVLWLVAQIERNDDCFREHTLSVAEMQRILGTSNGRLYEQMEDVCDQLGERMLEITNEQERTRTKHAWLHSAKYHDGKGKITLRFHDLLAPVLLQLAEQFCKVPLKEIFQLRGSYAIRWLEMLVSQEYYKTWDMTVAELRDWLAIPDDDLAKTGHLVSRAIEYPKKELDQKSHLSFDYSPHRQGKSIAGWTFRVRQNKPTQPAKKAKKSAAKAVAVAEPAPVAGPLFSPQLDFGPIKAKLKGGPGSPGPADSQSDHPEEAATPAPAAPRALRRVKDRALETPEANAWKAEFNRQEKEKRRALAAGSAARSDDTEGDELPF